MNHKNRELYKTISPSIDILVSSNLERLLYALAIPNFGRANARVIADHCRNKWDKIETLTVDELVTIDGIGQIMADSYVKFFSDPEKKRIVSALLKVLTIDETYTESGEKFKGMTFVITGDVYKFAGDALLVLWPHTRTKKELEDTCCRAMQCSRTIIEKLHNLDK